MPKKNQSFLTLIIIVLAVVAAIGLVRHYHIKNFHKIVPGVLYTCGQPRGMDYTRLLYKYHIGTIVNLRQSDEHREDHWYNEELTWTRTNGVNYVELPITKRPNYFPNVSTQQKFVRLMTDKSNLPVLLHGNSGKKRVAMLAAVWLVKAEKYSVPEAIEVVKKIKDGRVTKEEKAFIEGLSKKR